MKIEAFNLTGKTIRDSYIKEIKTKQFDRRTGPLISSKTVLVLEFTDGTSVEMESIRNIKSHIV